MLLPVTKDEMQGLGWNKLDIILVTGDTYIDSPYIGVSVIGSVLAEKGYKVGIIAQPDIQSEVDIMRLGEPSLFWGVTAGSVDSMVANYTALMKKRQNDDYTPGGINNKRPDRASIVYTNLIKRYANDKKPIVLGGIEASLRRIAHYDYWSDKIRKSILFDSKADVLVYGMAEKSIAELADRVAKNTSYQDVRGICYISNAPAKDFLEIPAYDEVSKNKNLFSEMFKTFYDNSDPKTAKGLYQKHDNRFLVCNPPAETLLSSELDHIYDINYTREIHPYYAKLGNVKAQATIKFAITSHRGCYGECNFCSISVHQGTTVVSRSQKSIVREAERIAKLKGFKGYITDVGGPTANMYEIECPKKLKDGACKNKRCVFPQACDSLSINHKKQIELLRKISEIKEVKKVFVASGIRHDMVLADKKMGRKFLESISSANISGQLKIAPEHTENTVLSLMGKPKNELLLKFKEQFDKINRKFNQYLTYYFIAAHPGCGPKEMSKMKSFFRTKLKCSPEQVQIFTPLPSTYSALMYHTEKNPFINRPIFVEKNLANKRKQKNTVSRH
ncbi:YgiQ family radical SAM protein [Elusimicrobiota bacterium]